MQLWIPERQACKLWGESGGVCWPEGIDTGTSSPAYSWHVMKAKWPLNSFVHAIHVKTVALTADSLLLLTSCCHVPRGSDNQSCRPYYQDFEADAEAQTKALKALY